MKKSHCTKYSFKNIFFGIFAEFRQCFGEVSHSAKCRFGEVSFRQSGFRRSVTDPCHPRFANGGLCKSKITDMAIITLEYSIHAADTVRKHIMLSIRKPVLSVLNMQKIININCSQCII